MRRIYYKRKKVSQAQQKTQIFGEIKTISSKEIATIFW